MRISEIVCEANIRREITDDLMDFISAYRTKMKSEVPMGGPNGVIAYLKKQGHVGVDAHLLMDLMSKSPFTELVRRSTPETISINIDEPTSEISPDEMDKSEKKVAKGAAKGAEKMVKNMAKAGTGI